MVEVRGELASGSGFGSIFDRDTSTCVDHLVISTGEKHIGYRRNNHQDRASVRGFLYDEVGINSGNQIRQPNNCPRRRARIALRQRSKRHVEVFLKGDGMCIRNPFDMPWEPRAVERRGTELSHASLQGLLGDPQFGRVWALRPFPHLPFRISADTVISAFD